MQSVTKDTLRIYWQHTMRYKWQSLLIAVGIVAVTAVDLYQPVVSRKMMDIIASNDRSRVWIVLWYILDITILSILHHGLWRMMGFTNSVVQPRIISDLFNTCFRHIVKHSASFFARTPAGALVSKLRRFPYAYESVDDKFKWSISRTLLFAVGITVIELGSKFWIGVLFAVWSILFAAMSIRFARFKLQYDIPVSDKDSAIGGYASDTFSNISVVHLFAAEEAEIATLEGHTQTLFELRRDSAFVGQRQEAVQGAYMISLQAIALLVAVGYWYKGKLTAGDLAQLQFFLILLFDHLWDLGHNIRSIYQSLASANEMTELLRKKHHIVDGQGAMPLQVAEGRLRLEAVTFGYDAGLNVLEGFTLDVAPGERVAIVGRSGAGKSTIGKLPLRIHEVRAGHIFIDGQDIQSVTLQSLRQAVAFVPQISSLFGRTLKQNIRYGNPTATDEQIVAAARLAYAHEFIEGCEQGYDTVVGERGITLSGGQCQRVAIARAFLKNAPILVLDEATSSLDAESESYIQQGMRRLMEGKTCIVIAHRFSTIQDSDRIIVVDGGKVVEEGTHEQLLNLGGVYFDLWSHQVNGFVSVE